MFPATRATRWLVWTDSTITRNQLPVKYLRKLMLIVEEKVLNGRIYVHQLRRGSQRHFNFLRRNCVLLRRMGRIIVERSRVRDVAWPKLNLDHGMHLTQTQCQPLIKENLEANEIKSGDSTKSSEILFFSRSRLEEPFFLFVCLNVPGSMKILRVLIFANFADWPRSAKISSRSSLFQAFR